MHEKVAYDLFEAFYASCWRMFSTVKSRDCAVGDGVSMCLLSRSCQERDITTDYPENINMLLLLMGIILRT